MKYNQRHNPFPVNKSYDGIYAHGVAIPAEAKLLSVSGQVGVSPEGNVSSEFGEQARQALENIESVLSSAGMSIQDLVHMRFFLTDRKYIDELARIRTQYLDGVAPAVTTFIVSGLVDKNWLIEIEGLASKPSASTFQSSYARMI